MERRGEADRETPHNLKNIRERGEEEPKQKKKNCRRRKKE